MLPNNLNKQEDWIERWHDGRSESYMQVPPVEVFRIRMKMIENRRKTKVRVVTLSIAAALVCCLIIGAIIRLNDIRDFKQVQGMAKKDFQLKNSIAPNVAEVNVQEKHLPSVKNNIPQVVSAGVSSPRLQQDDSISISPFTPILTVNKVNPDSIKASATLQNVPVKNTLVRKGELLYYVHLKNNQKSQDSLPQPVRAYDPPADLLQTSNKINTGDLPIHKFNH